jgi:hypothetical protein
MTRAVRPASEGDGSADERRAEEAGHAQEVHVAAPGDGFLQGQVFLKRVKVNCGLSLLIYTMIQPSYDLTIRAGNEEKTLFFMDVEKTDFTDLSVTGETTAYDITCILETSLLKTMEEYRYALLYIQQSVGMCTPMPCILPLFRTLADPLSPSFPSHLVEKRIASDRTLSDLFFKDDIQKDGRMKLRFRYFDERVRRFCFPTHGRSWRCFCTPCGILKAESHSLC